MAHIIIDRRKNDKGKSTNNRQRFVRRVKEQVKEAIKDVIRNGSIKDVVSDKNKKINIPGKGLRKPQYHHGNGGIIDYVHPGNKRYTQGDRIRKPQDGEGNGRGKNASPDGNGEDGFEFSLTREEFLDFFFQDLELPNLTRKEIAKVDEYVMKRSGFSADGPPSRLNIIRSVKLAKGRRFALRAPKKRELKKLEEQLEQLLALDQTDEIKTQIADIENRIVILKRKIKGIPFIDDVDLRYNRWDKFPNPTTQAVMFGIMDVSGSMGEWEKDMAKRFFMLLLLFLHYNYEKVDIVWIRHTTEAAEVDEDEFFYSRETGGTMVSPALQLMSKIIEERYPPNLWNIYGCQISDGDNWSDDTATAVKELDDKILDMARYFAYVEIDQGGGRDSDLWPHYEALKSDNPNFVTTVITSAEDIYPVFRSLFERKKST